MTGRLIAIGDIHGEVLKLNNLLEKLNLRANDHLVFLGDYIDRGHYSKQVVEKLIELSKSYKCEFLMGNHEYYLLKAANGDKNALEFFMSYGGVQTIDSYGNSIDDVLRVHSEFFNNLKYYYQTPKYLFVHAGVHPNKTLAEQEKFDMVIIRDNFINYNHILKQKVVFGHTPFEKPYIEDDKIGIDTGCGKYFNAPLTAFVCDSEDFVQS